MSSQLNELSNESLPETSSSDVPGIKRYRKPRFDTYTMMLLVSLIAIAVAITCLYMTMDTYEWKFRLDDKNVASVETPVTPTTTTYYV